MEKIDDGAFYICDNCNEVITLDKLDEHESQCFKQNNIISNNSPNNNIIQDYLYNQNNVSNGDSDDNNNHIIYEDSKNKYIENNILNKQLNFSDSNSSENAVEDEASYDDENIKKFFDESSKELVSYKDEHNILNRTFKDKNNVLFDETIFFKENKTSIYIKIHKDNKIIYENNIVKYHNKV